MSQELLGNIKGLKPSERDMLTRLYRRRLDGSELISIELAREIYRAAQQISRKVGVLVSRDGHIESVVIGTRDIVYLPDLGRYRLGKGRLRRIRLLFSDLSKGDKPAHIPADIYGDLEKLRLDAVVAIKEHSNRIEISYAMLAPLSVDAKATNLTTTIPDVGRLELDFRTHMEELENELQQYREISATPGKVRAIALGIYPASSSAAESSMRELEELARTAGVEIVDKIIQRKEPDPKTVIGKGRLEDAVLRALRMDADLLIFDCELAPSQWRVITNLTELKVIDRSMLILDIFAQRARTSDGRLQVELAQLKYNLPRLQEKDTGLSRLTGGIGGRGPGETKMEIGRRRIRDRITLLESRINVLSEQRQLRRKRRNEFGIPLAAIVGYTNVGKSTLFNALTGGDVLVENKLFATLDTTQRKLAISQPVFNGRPLMAVVSDTVGFIRELPNELKTAFRATLEELYDASVIVHVLDASDADVHEKYNAVSNTIAEMKLSEVPTIVILNKKDLVSQNELSVLVREFNGIAVSAINKLGFAEIKSALVNLLYPEALEQLALATQEYAISEDLEGSDETSR